MKKAGIVLLSFAFVISLVLSPAVSVKAAESLRYGYSLLTTDVQRNAYNEVVEGLQVLESEIPLSVQVNETTYQAVSEDVTIVMNMVIKDYPEFFWFTGAYHISGSVSKVDGKLSVKPEFRLNGQTVTAGSPLLADAQNRVLQAVAAAKATIPANASDYEIALALHDYLVENVQYLSVGDHQTVYGALVSGKAVCAGYARAYQLLMNEAGIPCSYVAGQSYDPSALAAGDAVPQPHAWNLVWLDGKCYYTDVTWDDQAENGLFHEYLNLSRDEIDDTHFPYDNEILPGSCGHDDYRFFVKNSGKGICDIQDTKDDADVAECFELKSKDGRNVVYYCTIHYHKDDFAQWFSAHYEAIGKKLGLESFECDLVELGHEHHVIYAGVLSESAPEPSVPVTNPTEASQTQPPTALPTEAPTGSSAATEPSAWQTEPVETTDSTDPTQPAEPTEPTQSSTEPDGTQPTGTGASEESFHQTETYASGSLGSGTSGAAASSELSGSVSSEPPAEPDDTVAIVIVAVVVLLGAAAGAVSYILIRKRRA